MKAVVQYKYGPPDKVLQLRDVEQPVPKDDEVLVRVHAASMHTDIWTAITGVPLINRLLFSGLRRPTNPIAGSDLAGHVEAIGKSVTRFNIGDEVFGESGKYGWCNGGAFAEYASVREDFLALKPKNVSFEQAAAVPASGLIVITNLDAIGKIRSKRNVLINGAGGCVGMFSIQIAKFFGAKVTAVDAENKLELIRSLGADRVVDYVKEDATRSDQRYDLVFDIASNLSLSDYKRVLTPDGKFVRVGHAHYGKTGRRLMGDIPSFIGLVLRAPFDPHMGKLTEFRLPKKHEAMEVLRHFLESGVITPIVAKTFPLDQVPEAIRCMQAGTALGRIIITP
jgi:NADPH:quinone reductase-like Zn-dependent oxidoreductase